MEGLKTGLNSFDQLTGGLDYRKTYLLLGDKDSGKENFIYKLVQSSLVSKNAIAYILTSKSYSDLINEFNTRGIPINQYLENNFKILDDYSRINSPSMTDNKYAKILNGPVDLTGLSVALSSVNSDFIKDAKPVINIIDNLSNLLLYNSPVTVYRFLQFICGKAKLSGVTTILSVDTAMHAPDVIETIKNLSDAVISLKLDNGKRYFTLIGSSKEVLEFKEVE
ncbi:MAG: RecA-superfamily ATPase implicated in signal transduction-like protein [Candidatus Parvarchaeum acidophilus ARMAN-5]|jgi:KaiC/GvpD/RAD55 family RecA-like ATPase|uniref:RecA-superfamily ATPase implicated in signal transduction-like protein n=1 Tax=Candidatus Parvarchaeum acidophilus ARMAN-5 TaxID=662762 RepID=D6GW22_PARA5|nr:MAG: RecA-superfamily ATPase implicated in signal transduction-like protein [Candidatus Parvarchaeum acidophilus ARMAN-5]